VEVRRVWLQVQDAYLSLSHRPGFHIKQQWEYGKSLKPLLLSAPLCRLTDHVHYRLLRARCERPHRRRTGEQRQDLAASYVEHGAPQTSLCRYLTFSAFLL